MDRGQEGQEAAGAPLGRWWPDQLPDNRNEVFFHVGGREFVKKHAMDVRYLEGKDLVFAKLLVTLN